jgi:hypothetical protein
MCENENKCTKEYCTKRHPKLCKNISKIGGCRHKEKCAYKHPEQQNRTDQGAMNEVILTLILWQQQQIAALSEEVKSLKSLNSNTNSEVEVVEKEYDHDDSTKKSLVKEVSVESFKCDVCKYKCKSEIILKNIQTLNTQLKTLKI